MATVRELMSTMQSWRLVLYTATATAIVVVLAVSLVTLVQ